MQHLSQHRSYWDQWDLGMQELCQTADMGSFGSVWASVLNRPSAQTLQPVPHHPEEVPLPGALSRPGPYLSVWAGALQAVNSGTLESHGTFAPPEGRD